MRKFRKRYKDYRISRICKDNDITRKEFADAFDLYETNLLKLSIKHPKQFLDMIMQVKMSKKICHECGCTTYKLKPHPQDSEQKVMVCEDCEYAMMARFDSLSNEPIKEYKDRRGV